MSINRRICLWDLLLIIGLCLAPMTRLRFWKIGPGELLCIIWCIKPLLSRKILVGSLTKFYTAFLGFMILGTIVGGIVAPDELEISGLLTWAFLGLMAILFYQGLKQNSLDYNEYLLSLFAYVVIAWYFFLFVYSKVIGNVFFGISLWYGTRRFAGGATNPHQLAELLCGVMFVFLRNIFKSNKSLFNVVFFGTATFLLIQTRSSTGEFAVALTVLFAIIFRFSDSFITSRGKLIGSLIVFAIPILLLISPTIYKMFMSWVASDPNGLGRFTILSSFPSTFATSPLVGLGPGVHAMGGSIEFHCTYTEILAATGIFGGIVFVVYSTRLFRNVIICDWTLLPIVLSLYVYGLGGFAMRRLIYWGLIAMVTTIEVQIKYKTNFLSIRSETVNG